MNNNLCTFLLKVSRTVFFNGNLALVLRMYKPLCFLNVPVRAF